MKFLHVPFLLVLTGLTVYFRDILNLPFYGSRIFIVNLYLLLFGIVLYLQSKDQKRLGKQAYLHFLSVRPFVAFLTSIFIFLYINILSNIINNEQEYYFILQILNFVFGFVYLYLIIFNDGLKSFIKSLSIALWLLLIFQFFLNVLGDSIGVFGEITSNRNGIAYLSLFFYVLYCTYGEGKARKELLLVVLFALLNQTTGVFILLTAYFLNYLSNITILRFRIQRLFYIPVVFLIIIFGSYFGIDLLLFYMETLMSELNVMENNRYYVPDNLASLISRLGSVPFTVEFLIQSENVFGLGPDAAAKLLYWGYPVHNYFVSLIAISGLTGILFSLVLLHLIYKISKLSLMLGVSGLFFLSVTNDLSLSFVLCFIPFIISRLNPSHKLKV